jgi:hypothetical protein
MMLNDELERMWKEAVVVNFKADPRFAGSNPAEDDGF